MSLHKGKEGKYSRDNVGRVSRKPGIDVQSKHHPVRKEAAELDSKLQEAHDYSIPATMTEDDLVRGEGPRKLNKFPVRLSYRDDYDTKANMKARLINEQGVVPGMGYATVTDEDLEHLERKRQALQYEDMYKFIDNYFPMTDPAVAKLVSGWMPEYYDRREQEIDKVAKLQADVAKLRLRGPSSREDLMTLYLLNSGALELTKGPIYAPEKWHGSDFPDDGFQRGLFNPKRMFASKIPDPSRRHDPLQGGAQNLGQGTALDSYLRASQNFNVGKEAGVVAGANKLFR
jgi:hypothetical protein